MSTIEITDEDGYSIEITDAPGPPIIDDVTAADSTWSSQQISDVVDALDRAQDWRAGYWESLQTPPMWDRPVVTWTSTTSTGLSSPVEAYPAICRTGSHVTGWNGLTSPTDTHFRFSGGSFQASGGGSNDYFLSGEDRSGISGYPWPVVCEFDVSDATDKVEVSMYYSDTQPRIGLEVDGHWLGVVRSYTALSTGKSMLLTFPGAKARRIRLWALQGLYAVRVPTGCSISLPSDPSNSVIAVVGDSWVNGAGSWDDWSFSGASTQETWASQVQRALGSQSPINAGVGGRGFTSVAGNYGTRAALVAAMNPDLLITVGSINDPVDGTGVQAAAEAYFEDVAGVGTHYVVGVLKSGWDDCNTAIEAACATAGLEYIDPGEIIATGSGKRTAHALPGNGSLLITNDGSHLTWQGHRAVARGMFYAISSRWLA